MDTEPKPIDERLLAELLTRINALLSGADKRHVALHYEDFAETGAYELSVEKDTKFDSLLVQVKRIEETGEVMRHSYVALLPDGNVVEEEIAEHYTAEEWATIGFFEDATVNLALFIANFRSVGLDASSYLARIREYQQRYYEVRDNADLYARYESSDDALPSDEISRRRVIKDARMADDILQAIDAQVEELGNYGAHVGQAMELVHRLGIAYYDKRDVQQEGRERAKTQIVEVIGRLARAESPVIREDTLVRLIDIVRLAAAHGRDISQSSSEDKL